MNSLGTAFLLGLLLVAAAALGVHWLWRTRIKRSYLGSYASMLFPVPGRISLRPAEHTAAKLGDRLKNRIETFRQLGFQELGFYHISEIQGALLQALVHPGNGLVAIVHQHPSLGTWSDVLRFSSNPESPFLASNVLKHAYFHFLPGDPKSHHPGADESELVRVVLASRVHEHSVATLTAANFPRLYEQAFAAAADQRTREPLNENEIRRLLKDLAPDAELSDSDIRGIHELLPETAWQDWRISILWEFLTASGIPAREWQQSRGKVLVIHDHTALRRLRSCPFSACFLTPELHARLKRTREKTAPRQHFAQLNRSLPSALRYKQLGQVEKPVPADIYRAPLPGGP